MFHLNKTFRLGSGAETLHAIFVVMIGLGMFLIPWRAECAPAPNPEQPAVRLLDAPPSADGRIRVELGVAIANLAEVDETREQFRVGGFIFAWWNDPRLAFSSRVGESIRVYQPDQIWTPGFQMLNAIELAPGQVSIRGLPDGGLRYAERFAATLSTKFYLRKFPFDSQNLDIVIAPFATGALRIDLKANKSLTELLSGRFLELAQWKLTDITEFEQTTSVGDAFQFEQVDVRLKADRRPAFYVWTMLLPLMVMLIVAWSVLWIAPDNFAQQLGIAMPTLLSVIAFSYAMSFTLPRVPYLTFLNAFFLTVYLFVAISVLEIVAIYVIGRRGREDVSRRLHAKGRWLFPCTYLVTMGIILALFFG